MADAGEHAEDVFRRSTINRIASADELDHYIKVTNPSAWAVLLAALLLVAGILVWALVAIVPVTVETTGITFNHPDTGEALVACWVDETTASRIEESGVKASVDGVEAESAELDKTPMSATEVVSFLGSDFYIQSIDLDKWNYLVVIEPGAKPDISDYEIATSVGESHLVPVSLVVSEKRPINIVMGKQ